MTTIHLSDLLDLAVLDEMIEAGFVRAQVSPDGNRTIYNYTEQAVYTRSWNGVTRQCRGLIVQTDSGLVVARPWEKFFNYGEHAADSLDLEARVEVTDKEDGSLGIMYLDSDGLTKIATRGSFTSEQAQHATGVLCARYPFTEWHPEHGWTYLFEIVYPANRIVRDYGQTDDLILLGAVHVATGAAIGPNEAASGSGWPGPVAHTFEYRTLADALAAEPRPGAEGLVVRYLDGEHKGTMVKIKQDDYVALHRIVTGLTARRIWERLAVWSILSAHPDTPIKRIGQALRMDVNDVQGIIDAGPDWQEQIEKTAPEEFTDWIRDTATGLRSRAIRRTAEVVRVAQQHSGWERKDIAAAIAQHPHRGMVFAALDRKPITPQVWAVIRPEAERPFRIHGEDVA